jgi:hypothetical protein
MATFKHIRFGDGLSVADDGANQITVTAGGAATFVSGVGPPTAAVGVDGAIYLDTSSGRMYGPKAAGAWPATSLGKLLLPGNTYTDVMAHYSNYAALLAG